MPALEHSRYKIYSKSQHPLNHSLAEFIYSNPNAPDVSNIEGAIDFIFNVLYPQTRDTVDWATEADRDAYGDPADTFLPLVGNTAGEYRNVVNGHTTDGGVTFKTAGYMWAKYDGDPTEVWHKTTVFDWGTGDIASVMIDRTKLLYYFKLGLNDVDENGDEVLGDLRGQSLYGGADEDTNLTLNANNGDPVGHSGFIQLNDNTRPLLDLAFNLGQADRRFSNIYAGTLVVGTGTLTVTSDATSATISDTSGLIDFANNTLTTTGNAVISNITISGDSIESDTDGIDFVDNDISTIGDVTASGIVSLTVDTNHFIVDDITIDGNTIRSAEASSIIDVKNQVIDFEGGELNGAATGVLKTGSLTVGLDAINSTGDIVLSSDDANGKVVSAMDIDTSGDVDAWIMRAEFQAEMGKAIIGSNVEIRENGVVISLGATELTLQSGTAYVKLVNHLYPSVTGSVDLGRYNYLFRHLWLSGIIYQTPSINMTMDQLMTLRAAAYRDNARLISAEVGDILTWSGDRWLATSSDGLDHGAMAGLLDDDHTQYPLLAGRTGGQVISGGTVATEQLTIRPYSSGRTIVLDDNFFGPATDGLIDLGRSGAAYGNIYATGQLISARMANVSTGNYPPAGQVGRIVFDTDTETLKVDNGTQYNQIGNKSCKGSFSQTDLDSPIDVSQATGHANLVGYVEDARDAIWQLKDSTGEILGVTITTTQTTVTISTEIPLPVDTYRLVGVQA